MRIAILFLIALAATAQVIPTPNPGDPIRIGPNPNSISNGQCFGNNNGVIGGFACSGVNAVNTGAPPYSQTVSGATTLTVTAATHSQGLQPFAFCFDNASPANFVQCAYSVSNTGTVVFTWSPAFTGSVLIEGIHQAPGGIVSLTSVSGAINTTETAVASASIAANFVQPGTTFLIRAYGTCTSTVSNVSTFKVRWGSAGSSADTLIGSVATANAATTGTNVPFYVEFTVTFQSTSIAEANGILNNNGITGITTTQTPIIGTPTNTTGLTTTSAEKLTLLYVSAGTTTTSTFQIANIDVEHM